jgi:hypothetical protein
MIRRHGDRDSLDSSPLSGPAASGGPPSGSGWPDHGAQTVRLQEPPAPASGPAREPGLTREAGAGSGSLKILRLSRFSELQATIRPQRCLLG